ncbi:hypothetical protein, conserved [Plasmodium gonderi]|uniref:Uncharacterized protein n=1 Tax=Plasmodium gonderi TaxID=77519 RepID=A0A1Y1JP48_PLAGO|nr:hypothetical protein, conserved [Plasmodium gonderi]GAW81824.1 hypothetical protein, conserved [Plasmodium gonderi]
MGGNSTQLVRTCTHNDYKFFIYLKRRELFLGVVRTNKSGNDNYLRNNITHLITCRKHLETRDVTWIYPLFWRTTKWHSFSTVITKFTGEGREEHMNFEQMVRILKSLVKGKPPCLSEKKNTERKVNLLLPAIYKECEKNYIHFSCILHNFHKLRNNLTKEYRIKVYSKFRDLFLRNISFFSMKEMTIILKCFLEERIANCDKMVQFCLYKFIYFLCIDILHKRKIDHFFYSRFLFILHTYFKECIKHFFLFNVGNISKEPEMNSFYNAVYNSNSKTLDNIHMNYLKNGLSRHEHNFFNLHDVSCFMYLLKGCNLNCLSLYTFLSHVYVSLHFWGNINTRFHEHIEHYFLRYETNPKFYFSERKRTCESRDPMRDEKSLGTHSIRKEELGVHGEDTRGEEMGEEKMGGEKIGGEKIGGEKMGGEKMGGEKMGGEKMGGEKMGGEKMGGEKMGKEEEILESMADGARAHDSKNNKVITVKDEIMQYTKNLIEKEKHYKHFFFSPEQKNGEKKKSRGIRENIHSMCVIIHNSIKKKETNKFTYVLSNYLLLKYLNFINLIDICNIFELFIFDSTVMEKESTIYNTFFAKIRNLILAQGNTKTLAIFCISTSRVKTELSVLFMDDILSLYRLVLQKKRGLNGGGGNERGKNLESSKSWSFPFGRENTVIFCNIANFLLGHKLSSIFYLFYLRKFNDFLRTLLVQNKSDKYCATISLIDMYDLLRTFMNVLKIYKKNDHFNQRRKEEISIHLNICIVHLSHFLEYICFRKITSQEDYFSRNVSTMHANAERSKRIKIMNRSCYFFNLLLGLFKKLQMENIFSSKTEEIFIHALASFKRNICKDYEDIIFNGKDKSKTQNSKNYMHVLNFHFMINDVYAVR